MSTLSSAVGQDHKPDGVRALKVRDLIEAARHLARLSRDEMMPALFTELDRMGVTGERRREISRLQQQARMDLVMDCYLTGCAEMLKRLFGDLEAEPWMKYSHEERLAQLLQTYGLLQSANAESSNPSSNVPEERQPKS